jgi:hypothetical protein
MSGKYAKEAEEARKAEEEYDRLQGYDQADGERGVERSRYKMPELGPSDGDVPPMNWHSLPKSGMEFKDEQGAEPGRILPYLFLGGKVHARDKATLKRLKINHILNMSPTRDTDPNAGIPNFFQSDKKFTYKRVPIFDNNGENIIEHLKGCIDFIDKAQYYGAVLVHCNQGVSRSTSMCLGYLMDKKGMTLQDAYDHIKKQRKQAGPNTAFRRQLELYDRIKRKERKAKEEKDAKNGKKRSAKPSALRGPSGPTRGPSGPARGPSGPVRGPSGPARGPTMPPSSGQSIGPAMPPSAQIGVTMPPKSAQIGVTMPPSASESIGPTMPPAKKQRQD